MAYRDLTAQQVRDALDYNPDTGLFVWRHRLSKAGRAVKCIGKQAGSVDHYGRITIHLHGRLRFAHRLAWLHHYGAWPEHVIDHINGINSDNRIANLRDVPQAVNMQNRRVPAVINHTGVLGVHTHPNTTKYRARVYAQGKEHHLGLFETVEEAHEAYLDAKRRLHVGCTL